MEKKIKWKIKHQGKWYPLTNVVDSGKPSHEDGGGNHYHLEGHNPIHQDDVEDIDMDGGDMEKADKIPGGLADKKKPSDFDSDKLEVGTKVEMEHTSDKSIAREIAMDHLAEDSEYYKKLKEVEKYDRVEITPDGKRELNYGEEELNKEPDIKKRWSKLKKALDSSAAIMDLSSAEGEDSDEGEQEPQQEATQPSAEDDAQGAQAEAQPSQETGDKAPEASPDQQQQDQEVIDFLREEGYEDSEIAYIIHNHSIPIPTKDDHAAQNEAAKGEAQLSQLQDDHLLQQDHAKEAHRQERRQDEEEHKITTEHKKRMSDVEYEKAKSELIDPTLVSEHKKKMLDIEFEIANKKKEQAALEVEHKKRMLELEYQKAHKEANKEDPTDVMKKEQMQFELQMKRMEKELEIEMDKKRAELEFQYKEKELKLNLKLKEEAAALKSTMQEEQMHNDHEVNMQVKAHQAKHKITESKKPIIKDKKQ